MKDTKPIIVVGIDASYSALGLSVLEFQCNKIGDLVYPADVYKVLHREVCVSPPTDETNHRLDLISEWVDRGINQAVNYTSSPRIQPAPAIIAIEGHSFGSKFSRESLGELHGALRLRLFHTYNMEFRSITPRAVKALACPHWPGFNKVNWLAAKRTGKFKASMPDKAAVIAGLQRRFGDVVHTDAEADSTLIALMAATMDKICTASVRKGT